MQQGEDPRYLKVVATAKHYADYDQEGNFGTDRLAFDANVSSQDQVEYYWPAFRAAVQSAGVRSIMCSYPAINGVPACGNDFFMNQVAREEWGFDGYVISDEKALEDVAFNNYVAGLYPNVSSQTRNMQQCRVGIEGGCDVDLGGFWLQWMQQAVEAEIVDESVVDRASHRFWSQVLETGKLDEVTPAYYTHYGIDRIDSAAHREIALHAAEQGMVLLKNTAQTLPIGVSNGASFAFIGPHANATQDMLSSYRGANVLVNSQSPFQALLRKYPTNAAQFAKGCDDVVCNSTAGFAHAIEAAKGATYAFVFLGLRPAPGQTASGCGDQGAACEAEGIDRKTIVFPGHQLDLLKAVVNATQGSETKVVLVLINGGQMDLSWPKQSDAVDVILEAFYPGECGGAAILNIVDGTAAVAGKLPYTVYDASLLEARPSMMDMSLRANGGITYRYYEGEAVYPFGFGLYLTTFNYTYYGAPTTRVLSKTLAAHYREGRYFYRGAQTSFTVQVQNTGGFDSDCVVLGFVTSDDADAPKLKLFDFQRVFVRRNEKVNVSLSVSPEAISIVNEHGNERIVPGRYALHLGDYQGGNYVSTQLVMEGEEESIFDLAAIKRRSKEVVE